MYLMSTYVFYQTVNEICELEADQPGHLLSLIRVVAACNGMYAL